MSLGVARPRSCACGKTTPVTAIHYPDRFAASPGGRYRLEARSPHNGTINHRDGTSATDAEFGFKYREHQRDFRYRLLDGATDAVLWERWQDPGEDSPHELFVSDDGWSILRTHGFRPEVIAVSPAGDDAVRVRVLGPPQFPTHADGQPVAPGRPAAPEFDWHATHRSDSTAGNYWSQNSCRYFFSHDTRPHFAWRTYWGQRLVLDLANCRALPESDNWSQSAAVTRACEEQERRWARGVLSELFARADDVAAWIDDRRRRKRDDDDDAEAQDDDSAALRALLLDAPAAADLAGHYRLHDCADLLLRCEPFDIPSHSEGSTAMPGDTWIEHQHLRPVVQHALRRLGREPLGYPTYHFGPLNVTRIAVPERTVVTEGVLSQLTPALTARQVLALVGPPHHVHRQSHPKGTLFEWTEDWEYDRRVDGRWLTRRITWEKARRTGRIRQIEDVPPYWLDGDERTLRILRL